MFIEVRTLLLCALIEGDRKLAELRELTHTLANGTRSFSPATIHAELLELKQAGLIVYEQSTSLVHSQARLTVEGRQYLQTAPEMVFVRAMLSRLP